MPEQRQLPLELPLPAAGTVAILRIEDLRKILLEALPVTKAANGTDGATVPERRRWISRHIDELRLILRGHGPDCHADIADSLDRTPHREINSITTSEIAMGWPAFGAPGDLAARKNLAGNALTRLGWQSRYLTSKHGARERRYFPPPGWL